MAVHRTKVVRAGARPLTRHRFADRARFKVRSLDDYMNHLDDSEVAGLTIELLKSRKVQVKFARSTEWDARWSLYQSLVSEQDTADGLFVLIEGRWFEISRTLAQRVDTFIARLEHTSVALLPSSAGEAEPAYNKRLAEADPNTRVCLDAKIINPGGASSGIEFCDVFTVDGAMVHVKRKSRSSTLSHLFAQGVVSATTLLSDGEFREKLRDQIAQATDGDSTWSAVIPGQDQQPARSAYTVSYVVIANSRRSDNTWRPFFSRLNLMLQARNLENLGIKFTLDRVDAG